MTQNDPVAADYPPSLFSRSPHQKRRTALKAGAAGGAGLLLLALVAGLVHLQAPTNPNAATGASPPIFVPPSPDEIPVVNPAPEPIPDLPPLETITQAPPKEPAPQTVIAKPDEPEPAIAPKSVVKAPARTVVPAPVPPPKASAEPPPAAQAPAPPPDPTVTTKTYDPRTLAASLKVKFKSMDDLQILTRGLHIDIVLEYGEHERYRIPRDLGTTTKVFTVSDKEFARWVADGRVTELVPTRELRDRLDVHVDQVRYLAVLDPDLRDTIGASVEQAQGQPGSTTVTIARGPVVVVEGI